MVVKSVTHSDISDFGRRGLGHTHLLPLNAPMPIPVTTSIEAQPGRLSQLSTGNY